MKLSDDLIIPDSKISQYLLIYREQDDKSKFLAQAGFAPSNPDQLKDAILELVETTEAIEDSRNEYGIFYRVEGNLKRSRDLAVVTIWLERTIDKRVQFITLKPKKEKKL
jgi:hypothetical protein